MNVQYQNDSETTRTYLTVVDCWFVATLIDKRTYKELDFTLNLN